jgi:hypothetical protein
MSSSIFLDEFFVLLDFAPDAEVYSFDARITSRKTLGCEPSE